MLDATGSVIPPGIVAATGSGRASYAARASASSGWCATGSLRRSEFGIEFGLLPIGMDTLALGDEVRIELDLEVVEPQDDETVA